MNLFPALRAFVLAALLLPAGAQAFVVDIDWGSEAIYLRVGDGSFVGQYAYGGIPLADGTISKVSVTVPLADVGNGVSRPMTANSRVTSDWDNFAFCNTGQLYIGGFYRRNNNGNQSATLTYDAPANLVNSSGDTIPISQISWTSSGNGDGGATQPVPGRTFAPGVHTLATNFLRNTWRESCLSFRYANGTVVPAGTYTARVTFTLAAP